MPARQMVKSGWYLLLPLCFLGILSDPSFAQDTRSERLGHLANKVDSLVTKYLPAEPLTGSPVPLNQLDHLFQVEVRETASPEVQLIEAEQEKLSRDIGLDLRAGYLENLEQGVFNVEGIYYRRRAQLELEWDVLNNGLLDNRQEIKELENEKSVARFRQHQFRGREAYDSLNSAIEYYFNRQKISILSGYHKVLTDRHEVVAELHQLNYRPWEDVLSVTSERAQAQVELESYRELNRRFGEYEKVVADNSILPLVNIDLKKLLEFGRYQSLEDSIVSEQIGRINNEYNAWRDISLSTFVRYNYYNSTSDINLNNVRNREYFSIGLNLSVPLPLHKADIKKIAGIREDILNTDLKRNKNRGQERLYSAYSNYQQKIKQYLGTYEHYLQLQSLIKKQQQRKSLQDPAYRSMEVMELIAARYEAAMQLTELKQDLYEILLGLAEEVPADSFSELLYPIDAQQLLGAPVSFSTDAYMWSATFEAIPNRTIVESLRQRQIGKLILSTGTDDTLHEKAEELVELAGQNQISVDLLIGDNELFMEGHQKELQQIFNRAARLGVSGVHLDVEPHTRNDWDSRKEEYLQSYVEFLNRADKLAEEHRLKLSISVPVFYDEILPSIAAHADKVYVMAYGSSEAEQLKERLTQEVDALADKLIIALRPADFNSFQEYTSFRNELSDKTGVRYFALHDMEALLNLSDHEMTEDNYEE